MASSPDLSHIRFLAIVLPGLTLSTHILLALSSPLSAPSTNHDRVVFSLLYNVIAAGASASGLIGALRLVPSLITAYTVMHAITLSLVNMALIDIIIPFNMQFVNPVMPSWQIDEAALCREMDVAGFSGDEWMLQCARGFGIVRLCVASGGLLMMIAQWWALSTVRRWQAEIRAHGQGSSDVENNSYTYRNGAACADEKCGLKARG